MEKSLQKEKLKVYRGVASTINIKLVKLNDALQNYLNCLTKCF